MFFSHYAVAAFAGAAGSYQAARLEARSRAHERQLEIELEQWEDDNILPLMSAEAREKFLVERRRLKERKEDIARQERQHRELVAAEREKASAIREAGRNRSSMFGGFAGGLIVGSLLDD